MLIALTTLLSILTSIFRSQAALRRENLALRHQIGVLQRSSGKRPRLTPADRLVVGLAVPHLERLARGAGHRETRNPYWGAPHIHGELLKLGIDIGESRVSKHMVHATSWADFTGSGCLDRR